MSYCKLYKDYPLRVQLLGGVIHAGKMTKLEAHSRYIVVEDERDMRITKEIHVPKREYVSTACDYIRERWDEALRRYVGPGLIFVENNPPITCKNCLRELGDEDHQREYKTRFVIMTKEGLFFKDYGRVTAELGDAKLYKVKKIAIKNASKRVFTNLGGRPCDYNEWMRIPQQSRPRPGVAMGDGLSVKEVAFMLLSDER